ncbi:unnamed protein product [Mycena citricolor]|uniref:Probable beta-glucosidase G n=1 Tax=Mycena citricolor TaxID=2018698 RepID=A0AAD2Q6C4_9AGAR|nr:unnamed protein product [Mycena citricolor]
MDLYRSLSDPVRQIPEFGVHRASARHLFLGSDENNARARCERLRNSSAEHHLTSSSPNHAGHNSQTPTPTCIPPARRYRKCGQLHGTLRRRWHVDQRFQRSPGPLEPDDDSGEGIPAPRIFLSLVSSGYIQVNITSGFDGSCAGVTGQIVRLGIPPICLQDGPTGVRPARRVSQFPAGITTAATWNRDLIAARGTALAREFHDKGANIWIGPVTGGPMGRSPFNGRLWEGFGPDPYLHGVASFLTVKSAQAEGVVTCSKHYLAYEQETFRNPYGEAESYDVFPVNAQDPISSNLDDKTAHELYMWPFAEAVRAGSGTVMCSYNEVNSTHACANDVALNKWLKGELGFQGAVVSDWGGTWDTKTSTLFGLDVTMPGSGIDGLLGNFYGAELIAMVQNGTIPEKRLDDMVLRTLAPILELQDLQTYPRPSLNQVDLTIPTNNVRRDHYKIIRQIAQEAITMVKNNRTGGGGLPFPALADMASLAVIGQDAGPAPYGMTSCDVAGNTCPHAGNNGTLTVAGGSGFAYPPYTIDPLAAINAYVAAEGPDINQHLENHDLAAAALQASVSEAAIVFLSAYASEGYDRANLTTYPNGDALVQAVAAVNKNTIVVLHVPGAVIVEDWIDHPNVTAVLIAYLPGQESGNSLAPVLWGETSPSGKLPYTFAKDVSDWPPNGIMADAVLKPQVNFTEKLLIDYKWFDAKNITPRFEFGLGLSYTTFSFGQLSLNETFKADNTSIQPTAEQFVALPGDSGKSMYDVLYTATVSIENTGQTAGAEVAQLYVSFPSAEDEPPRVLRGFDKLQLSPGQQGTATFELTRKDLSVWDVSQQKWRVPKGSFTISVGASSRDLRSEVVQEFA